MHASDHPHTVVTPMFRKVSWLPVVKPDVNEENAFSDYGARVLHSTVVLNTNHLPNISLVPWSLDNILYRTGSLNEMSSLVSGI